MKAGIVTITVWLIVSVTVAMGEDRIAASAPTATSHESAREQLLDPNQAAKARVFSEGIPTFDPRNIPVLVQILADPKEDESTRFHAASVLGLWWDPRAVDMLVNVANDPKIGNDRRMDAIHALGEIQYDSPAVIDVLLKTLESPNLDIESASATSLGKLGNPKAVDPILKCLREAKSDRNRQRSLIGALCDLGDKRAIPALLTVLSNEKNEPIVREDAACALGTLRANEAVKPLIQLLRSEDVSSRFTAAIALGRIADARSAEALVSVLNDQGAGTAYVNDEAERALWAIGAPATKALEAGMSSDDPEIAKKCADLLEGLKPRPSLQQQVDKYITDLDSKDKKVREFANDKLNLLTTEEFDDASKWKSWWAKNRDTWESPMRPHFPRVDGNMEIVSDPTDAIRKALPKELVILKVVRSYARASVDVHYVLAQPIVTIYVGLSLFENPIEKGKPWYKGAIRICPSGTSYGDDEAPMALANVSNGYILYHGSADLGKLLKEAVIRKRPQSVTATASAPVR